MLVCVFLKLLKVSHSFYCLFVVKLGIGGFSMGAATSLYSATCFVLGKYGNGTSYSTQLSVVIGLSGWLPCSKLELLQFWFLSSTFTTNHIFFCCPVGFNTTTTKNPVEFHFPRRVLNKKMESVVDAATRASSLPILLCHGRGII